MNLDYVLVFLQATLIEIPVFALYYWHLSAQVNDEGLASFPSLYSAEPRWRCAKIAGLVTLTNLCTHPIAFFGFLAASKTYLFSIAAAEIFSIVGESALQTWATRIPLRRTLEASVIANLVSWQLGSLLTYWIYF